jgi:hypothetical protein
MDATAGVAASNVPADAPVDGTDARDAPARKAEEKRPWG